MTPVDDVTNEEILPVIVGSFLQCNIHKYVGTVVAVPYAFWCLTAYKPDVTNKHGEIFILTPTPLSEQDGRKDVRWNLHLDWYFVFIRKFIQTESTEIHKRMSTYHQVVKKGTA